MSFSHSPRAITDGLVFYVDASNPLSYNGSGNTWFDLSGNRNHGTLYNGTAFSGLNSGTMNFDGTNDYVDCGNIIRGRTEFTAMSWIKTTETRTGSNGTYHNPSIFGTQHGSGVSGDFAITLKGGYFGFYHEIGTSGGYGQIETSSYLADDKWYHIAVTKSTEGVICLYVNGREIYNASGYASTLRTSDTTYSNWELGRAYWYGEDASMLRYTGAIANHLFYSRPLSQNEINQNFEAVKSKFGL